MLGEAKMNGEHGKIYDRINVTHKEILDHIIEMRGDISSIKATVLARGDLCKNHNDRLFDLERCVSEARGGVLVVGVVSSVVGLFVVLKTLGVF